MPPLSFEAAIDIFKGNPFVPVSREQAAQLRPGWRKPMPVLVQINGQPEPPWRINLMPAGAGDYYLYLHGDVRKATRTAVGDLVTVDVSFDDAYGNGPQHPMPDELRSALDGNAAARQAWEALIPSRQKEILRYFASLKSDAARQRNLERALHVLSGHAGRFIGRSWKDGS